MHIDTLTTVFLSATPLLIGILFCFVSALVHAAWRLWRSEDEREWFRVLRQAKRARRRQDWARIRETCRTDLWHRGDGRAIIGLLLLATIVMVLCR